MYKNILVPVDLGNAERGKSMIAKAVSLCDQGGKITLLNVIEQAPSYIMAELPRDLEANRRNEAEADMRAMAGKAGGNIDAEVRIGKASTEIIQAAKDIKADLIIIASHNPGMQDYFIGSTAARVVRHAGCSVLVDR